MAQNGPIQNAAMEKKNYRRLTSQNSTQHDTRMTESHLTENLQDGLRNKNIPKQQRVATKKQPTENQQNGSPKKYTPNPQRTTKRRKQKNALHTKRNPQKSDNKKTQINENLQDGLRNKYIPNPQRSTESLMLAI